MDVNSRNLTSGDFSVPLPASARAVAKHKAKEAIPAISALDVVGLRKAILSLEVHSKHVRSKHVFTFNTPLSIEAAGESVDLMAPKGGHSEALLLGKIRRVSQESLLKNIPAPSGQSGLMADSPKLGPSVQFIHFKDFQKAQAEFIENFVEFLAPKKERNPIYRKALSEAMHKLVEDTFKKCNEINEISQKSRKPAERELWEFGKRLREGMDPHRPLPPQSFLATKGLLPNLMQHRPSSEDDSFFQITIKHLHDLRIASETQLLSAKSSGNARDIERFKLEINDMTAAIEDCNDFPPEVIACEELHTEILARKGEVIVSHLKDLQSEHKAVEKKLKTASANRHSGEMEKFSKDLHDLEAAMVKAQEKARPLQDYLNLTSFDFPGPSEVFGGKVTSLYLKATEYLDRRDRDPAYAHATQHKAIEISRLQKSAAVLSFLQPLSALQTLDAEILKTLRSEAENFIKSDGSIQKMFSETNVFEVIKKMQTLVFPKTFLKLQTVKVTENIKQLESISKHLAELEKNDMRESAAYSAVNKKYISIAGSILVTAAKMGKVRGVAEIKKGFIARMKVQLKKCDALYLELDTLMQAGAGNESKKQHLYSALKQSDPSFSGTLKDVRDKYGSDLINALEGYDSVHQRMDNLSSQKKFQALESNYNQYLAEIKAKATR